MKFNLYNDIQKNADLRNSQIALIDGTREISYKNLLKSSDAAAKVLKTAGMKKYSRCLLIGPDSSEYLIAALAVLANHAVFVSAGKEINNNEFNELLHRIAIEYVIIDDEFCSKLTPDGYKKSDTLEIEKKKYNIFSKKQKKDAELEKLNPAFIRFSSGTTGDSKGIVLSHETIKARTESANSALNIDKNDHVLWLLPMAYHFAVTIILFLRKGCTIDISVDDPQEEILEKLKNGKTTFVYATPYHYGNVIRAVESMGKQRMTLPHSIRLLISTAMPLSEELFAKFAKIFGRKLNQAYGIIECGLPFVNTKPTDENGTSVGKHLQNYDVRLALQDHSDPAGEIIIKGPGFFDAYYDPWIKSEDVLLKGGWFHTGDMGKFAPGGSLNIVGRKKSVINFLGLKIFPEKIENILNSHPSVKESRIIGEKHPDFGEIPFAEIILKKGKKIKDIELTKYCAERLPSHEVPQGFSKVDIIPKTRSGKIERK